MDQHHQYHLDFPGDFPIFENDNHADGSDDGASDESDDIFSVTLPPFSNACDAVRSSEVPTGVDTDLNDISCDKRSNGLLIHDLIESGSDIQDDEQQLENSSQISLDDAMELPGPSYQVDEKDFSQASSEDGMQVVDLSYPPDEQNISQVSSDNEIRVLDLSYPPDEHPQLSSDDGIQASTLSYCNNQSSLRDKRPQLQNSSQVSSNDGTQNVIESGNSTQDDEQQLENSWKVSCDDRTWVLGLSYPDNQNTLLDNGQQLQDSSQVSSNDVRVPQEYSFPLESYSHDRYPSLRRSSSPSLSGMSIPQEVFPPDCGVENTYGTVPVNVTTDASTNDDVRRRSLFLSVQNWAPDILLHAAHRTE